MADKHLGIDIDYVNDMTATYGDVDLAQGRDCLVQDLVRRFMTPRGDLWCHPNYGVDLYQFVNAEATEINKLDLVQVIKEEALAEPRIEQATVKLLSWDGYTVKLRLTVTEIVTGNDINLVIGYNLATMSAEVLTGGRL